MAVRGGLPLSCLSFMSIIFLFAFLFSGVPGLNAVKKPHRALNCSAPAQNVRTYHRPNTEQPLMYISARFRIGEKRRWSGDLYRFGCHVLNSGVFEANEVRIIGDELPLFLTSSDVFDRHRKYLRNTSDSSRRGAGYWYWKPIVVQQYTSRSSVVKDGTIIVYSDLDRPDVVGYVGDLIEKMIRRGHDFAVQQWKGGHEATHTKGDTFERFGVYKHLNDPKSRVSRTPQYSANFFVVQKKREKVDLSNSVVQKLFLLTCTKKIQQNSIGFHPQPRLYKWFI